MFLPRLKVIIWMSTHTVTIVWSSANEAAGFIGVIYATDPTPDRFSCVYASVWDKLYNVSSASNDATNNINGSDKESASSPTI